MARPYLSVTSLAWFPDSKNQAGKLWFQLLRILRLWLWNPEHSGKATRTYLSVCTSPTTSASSEQADLASSWTVLNCCGRLSRSSEISLTEEQWNMM